jgi:hypothetical protein
LSVPLVNRICFKTAKFSSPPSGGGVAIKVESLFRHFDPGESRRRNLEIPPHPKSGFLGYRLEMTL